MFWISQCLRNRCTECRNFSTKFERPKPLRHFPPRVRPLTLVTVLLCSNVERFLKYVSKIIKINKIYNHISILSEFASKLQGFNKNCSDWFIDVGSKPNVFIYLYLKFTYVRISQKLIYYVRAHMRINVI